MPLLLPHTAQALDLDRQRRNQVTICTASAPASPPSFTLIFSPHPLAQTLGQGNNGHLSRSQLDRLAANDSPAAVVGVGGKEAATKTGCYEYSFGEGRDGDRPWNNGGTFDGQGWQRYSDESWDNLTIAPAIASTEANQTRATTVTQVVVQRGGAVLFDSAKTHSVPNHTPIAVALTPSRISADGDGYAVLDLSAPMQRFKRLYYELGDNAVLLTAYADLGQRERSKYQATSPGWCSEFASFALRANGISAPAANSEINWRGLKRHFAQHGTIYPLREVWRWDQPRRERLIKPGSLISIVNDHGTAHTLLLTRWQQDDEHGTFSAISGNSHGGMVWHHAALSLAQLVKEESQAKMTPDERRRFEARSFVIVPTGL